MLTARLHALEARGLAVLGEAKRDPPGGAHGPAVLRVVTPDGELPWLGHYTEHDLIADIGLGLSNIGETKQALTLNTTALQGLEPWRSAAAP
ncbi:MAG: hypothetical protein ACRDTE_30270 [Pseudonocardiaceae bacterium]